MAKVGKINRQFNLDQNWLEFGLYYTSKEGFYIKGVPNDFIRLTGFKIEGYSTESDLIMRLDECIRLYKRLTKSQRKVIAYNIKASTDIRMNAMSDGSYQGVREGINQDVISGFDALSMRGTGFGFEFRVYMEVDEGGKKYYRLSKDDIIGHQENIPRDCKIIDWTPEREEFFHSIKDSMYKMVVKISTFFSDTDKFLQLVDSGVKLLKD